MPWGIIWILLAIVALGYLIRAHYVVFKQGRELYYAVTGAGEEFGALMDNFGNTQQRTATVSVLARPEIEEQTRQARAEHKARRQARAQNRLSMAIDRWKAAGLTGVDENPIPRVEM